LIVEPFLHLAYALAAIVAACAAVVIVKLLCGGGSGNGTENECPRYPSSDGREPTDAGHKFIIDRV
jgi:hypothetical protein